MESNKMNIYVFARTVKQFRKYEKTMNEVAEVCNLIFVLDGDTIKDAYNEYYMLLDGYEQYRFFHSVLDNFQKFINSNIDINSILEYQLDSSPNYALLKTPAFQIRILDSCIEKLYHVIVENLITGDVSYQILTKEHIKSIYKYEIQSNN